MRRMRQNGQNGGLNDQSPVLSDATGLVEHSPVPVLPISMHTPTLTPVTQNRRRMAPPAAAFVGESSLPAPSLTSLPAHLVANAHRRTNEEMNALHRKLAALYTLEQFEPTPINPNLQLSM